MDKSNKQILTVLFLGVLMAALDIAIVGPALPAIRTAFRIDDRAVAWVFTIYVLFNLIGSPLMAKLSDRYGRRPVYMLDIALFALGSLIVALSPNFAVLLIGRAAQGLGAGGIFPVASAVIGDVFPAEKRGSALGLIGAVFGVAFVVGPIVGGILLLFGWHWLFYVNLPLAGLLLWLSSRTLPATRAPKSQPFDWAGMLILSAMLTGLTFGVSQLDTNDLLKSFFSWQVWPALLIAALLLPLFIRLEQQAADPIITPGLLETRQLRLGSLLAMGAGLGEAALVFLPALAVAAFAVSESNASFLTLAPVLAMAVGSPLAGRLLDKWGSRKVILLGTSVLTVGMFILSFFGSVFWLFIVAGVIVGAGLGSLLGAPLRYIMLAEAAPRDRAAAQSILTISMGIGQMFSGALVGTVSESQGGGVKGYSLAFLLVSFVALALVGLALGLKPQSQEKPVASKLPHKIIDNKIIEIEPIQPSALSR